MQTADRELGRQPSQTVSAKAFDAGRKPSMRVHGSLGFSDLRLKKHVRLIERLANGLGIYLYRHLWETRRTPEHVGVMADEVARIVPEALGPRRFGFMTVNYAKLKGLI